MARSAPRHDRDAGGPGGTRGGSSRRDVSDGVLWLCGGFLGAVLLNGALKYVKQNVEGYISETMLRDLRGELYNRILRFPLLHLKNTSTGQLVAMILGEVEDLGGYFGLALSTPAFHGAMLIGTLGFMVYANPWMAGVSMVLFPIQMVGLSNRRGVHLLLSIR